MVKVPNWKAIWNRHHDCLKLVDGIANLDKSSSTSNSIQTAKCSYWIDNISNLLKIMPIIDLSCGPQRDKSGWQLWNQPTLSSGSKVETLISWELCSIRSRCLGTGQLKSTTSRLVLSASGEQSRQVNTLGYLLKTNGIQWEMWWRKISLIGNTKKLETSTWNTGSLPTQ